MNRILFAALTLGLMLGLAGIAGAADEKKKKKNDGADVTAAFTKLDANGDKKVTKEEFDAFKGLQTPKPGKEGKERKGLAELRGTWFTKLDANTDGSVTAQEFAKLKEVVAANPPEKKKKKVK